MAQLALQQNLGAVLSVTSEVPGEALGGDLCQDSALHQGIEPVSSDLHAEIALCMRNDRDHAACQEMAAKLLEIGRENLRRQLEQEVAPAIERQHATVFQPLQDAHIETHFGSWQDGQVDARVRQALLQLREAE